MNDAFEPYLRARGLAPHSVSAYLGDLRFVEDLLERPAEAVTRTDLDQLFSRPGISVARNQRLRDSWNAYVGFAKTRLGSDLPEAEYGARARIRVKPSLEPDERLRVLSVAAAAAASGDPDGSAIALLLHTGMRSEEARTRKVRDVRADGYLLVHGKEDKDRLVPIFTSKDGSDLPSAADVVRGLISGRQPDSFLLCRSDRSPWAPWSKSRLYDACRRIGSAAGIGDLNPHRLRRGFATHLRRLGVDPTVIQAFLGHAKLTTTQLYWGVSQVDFERARALVDGSAAAP